MTDEDNRPVPPKGRLERVVADCAAAFEAKNMSQTRLEVCKRGNQECRIMLSYCLTAGGENKSLKARRKVNISMHCNRQNIQRNFEVRIDLLAPFSGAKVFGNHRKKKPRSAI